MPWTAEKAHEHKKGLSKAQASKWASIANAVLKSCRAKKGKDCEARAIRTANSRVSSTHEHLFGKDN